LTRYTTGSNGWLNISFLRIKLIDGIILDNSIAPEFALDFLTSQALL